MMIRVPPNGEKSRWLWIGVCAGSLLVFSEACTGAGLPTDDDAILRKAQRIVAEYTPDKKVWVRSFKSGARVMGLSLEPAVPEAPAEGRLGPQVEVTLPDWLDPNMLLGRVDQGAPTTSIRLLWKVEPRLEPPPEVQRFSVTLLNHNAYAQVQRGEPALVHPAQHPYGTVFWTQHNFVNLRIQPPGLYDVFVSNNEAPFEKIPLGQLLFTGYVAHRADNEKRMRELFPTARIVFAGNGILASSFRLRVPVDAPGFEARTLALVSTADWLENAKNLTEVATIKITRNSRQTEIGIVKLGRDSVSSWYDFHSRGNMGYGKARVAWSWPQRSATVDFEAHTYLAEFDLGEPGPVPSEIEIAYSTDEGLLRIFGIALLP